MRSRSAFTLAEVLLALGLIAVVVLSLLGLSLVILQDNRKAIDLSAGQMVAEGELQKAIYQAEQDSAAPLWTQDSPTLALSTYTVRVGSTDYQLALYAQDLRDTSGNPLGGSSGNRAKKVDVVVSWWDAGSQGRPGYGQLQVRNSRVVDGP